MDCERCGSQNMHGVRHECEPRRPSGIAPMPRPEDYHRILRKHFSATMGALWFLESALRCWLKIVSPTAKLVSVKASAKTVIVEIEANGERFAVMGDDWSTVTDEIVERIATGGGRE